jgi:hypothetical protein
MEADSFTETLARVRVTLLRMHLEATESAVSDLLNTEKKRVRRRWVRIPVAITQDARLGRCIPSCLACLYAGTQQVPGSSVALSHGSGLAFKVLLTLFRWAHPFSELSTYRVDWGTTNLSTDDLIGQIGTNEDSDPWNRQRNMRNAANRLARQGFVEIVRTGLRTPTYVPHVFDGSTTRVPDNLWRNGWIGCLEGSSLYLLVNLLWRAREDSEYRIPSFRIPRLQAYGLNERRLRSAFQELSDAGLVTEANTRKGRFIVLLDPDLLRKP